MGQLCPKCGAPDASFYVRSDTGKPYSVCKDCIAKKEKARRAANPEKESKRHRAWLLKTGYGISLETYDSMLAEQGGLCAICLERPEDDQNLHVDHDHKSGRIRGLLCYRCNVAIGYMKDYKDRLDRAAEYVDNKPPIEIKGFFTLTLRERGKIVPDGIRTGFNIWTLTGREFLARLMSYAAYGPTPSSADTPARNDRIRYIGFGVGTTPEVSSVARLVSPIKYTGSGDLFLAELALPTYPFQTAGSFGTAVRYTREFSESELSTSGTIILTEAGLFTDGSPTSSPVPYTPKTRDRSLAQAGNQAPAGYKTFEPLKKTTNFVLQTAWEVRF